MEETWKPVTKEPFSSAYEVSNLGNVRRLSGFRKNGARIRGGAMSKVLVKGYHLVLMQVDGAKWMARVHHLVALAFIGTPPGEIGVVGYTVNHKNFDKLDNRVENLEWMTSAENHQHAVNGGRKAHGERHYKARLNSDMVRRIRQLRASGMLIRQIASEMLCKEHLVSDVLCGRCWKHVI